MTEADMTILFGKYIRSIKPKKSAVFELKIAKGPLPFSAVKPHQIEALQAVTREGLYHKITDTPWGTTNKFRFTQPKPFDSIYLVNIEAFIVLWFYHPRKPKEFIFIEIFKFLNERDSSSRKSLTEQRAKEIGSLLTIKKES